MPTQDRFTRAITNHYLFALYLLFRLPLGFFAGLRVDELTEERSVVSLPYNFITKNPFQSVYFAALAMAGELASGIAVIRAIKRSGKDVSMLVFDMKAHFSRKAVTRIHFTCTDVLAIGEGVSKAVATGEGITVPCESIGTDKTGAEVCRFTIIWTLKVKQR